MSFSFNNNARVSNLEMLKNTMLYKSSLGIKDKTWKNWAESINNIIKSINGKKKIKDIDQRNITTLKEIIEKILKNLKKNNLKKFKYGAFGGLIQKERRIRKLLEKIIDFLDKINGKTRQKLFNDNKLSITRNLKKAYNTAIKTNQYIASEVQPRSSSTTPNTTTKELDLLDFLKKEFLHLNKLYKNIEGDNFHNFEKINTETKLINFCKAINILNTEIKTKITKKVMWLKNVNIDEKIKTYEFIVSYNYFINNLKEYCTSSPSINKLPNNIIKEKIKSIGSSDVITSRRSGSRVTSTGNRNRSGSRVTSTGNRNTSGSRVTSTGNRNRSGSSAISTASRGNGIIVNSINTSGTSETSTASRNRSGNIVESIKFHAMPTGEILYGKPNPQYIEESVARGTETYGNSGNINKVFNKTGLPTINENNVDKGKSIAIPPVGPPPPPPGALVVGQKKKEPGAEKTHQGPIASLAALKAKTKKKKSQPGNLLAAIRKGINLKKTKKKK